MNDLQIRVTAEAPWVLAKVVKPDGSEYEDQPFYAQGLSLEEALANLFSVIRTIKEEAEEKTVIPPEGLFLQMKHLSHA